MAKKWGCLQPIFQTDFVSLVISSSAGVLGVREWGWRGLCVLRLCALPLFWIPFLLPPWSSNADFSTSLH